jgi:hypothetical protein
MPPNLFVLGNFQKESCNYVWASLDHDTSIYTSHIAGMTGAWHHGTGV